MTRRARKSELLFPAALGFGCAVLLSLPLLYAEVVDRGLTADLAVFAALLLALLAACAAFVALPFLLWRRARPNALRILAFSAPFASAMVACCLASVPARRFALERFVGHATPVVAAIEAFERSRGRPPAHLGELVPDFLDRLPPAIYAGGSDPEYALLPAPEAVRRSWYELDPPPAGSSLGASADSGGDPEHPLLVFDVDDAGSIVRARLELMPRRIRRERFDRSSWIAGDERLPMARSARALHPPGASFADAIAALGPPDGSRAIQPPRWELRVSWGWDLLCYRPTHEYPDGGSRIGDWVYRQD